MPWTNRELLTAFPNLIKKGQHSAKLYFFIDGLDEFEGDDATRVEIITLLKEISDSSRVKVCLSSCSWLIFADAFKSRPSLLLLLQQMTYNNIKELLSDRTSGQRAVCETQTKRSW